MRVSSPSVIAAAQLCVPGCSLHMSRPPPVWFVLKHLAWFDCVGGCAVTSRGTKGEIERKQVISWSVKVWEKIRDGKARFSCPKRRS